MTPATGRITQEARSCHCRRHVSDTRNLSEITREQNLAGLHKESSLDDPVVEVDDSAARASLIE